MNVLNLYEGRANWLTNRAFGQSLAASGKSLVYIFTVGAVDLLLLADSQNLVDQQVLYCTT